MTDKSTALATIPERPQLPGRTLTSEVALLALQIAPSMRYMAKTSISEPQAAAMMMMAYEYGFNMTSAFQLIHWIGGPVLSAEAMLALLISSKLVKIKVVSASDAKGEPTCTVTMSRRDQELEYTTTFSLEDARKAKLVKPDSGWDKYPRRMVLWRAVSDCASVVAPDIVAGLHIAPSISGEEPPPIVDPKTGEIVDEGEYTLEPEVAA